MARRAGPFQPERGFANNGRFAQAALSESRDTLLPLLEHAMAYLNKFGVGFHLGVQFL